MRAVLIAVVTVLALPAFAHEHEHHRGPPVVLDKDELSSHLEQINAQLSVAIVKSKKDKKVSQLLHELRDQLEDLSADVDEAMGPRDWWSKNRDQKEFSNYMPDYRGGGDRDGRYDRDGRDRDGRADRDYRGNNGPGQPPQYGQPGYNAQAQVQVGVGAQPAQYQPQPAPRPGPAPQATVYPIEERSMKNLLAAIDHESFPNDRMRVLTQAAANNYFVTEQVKALITRFDFPRDRLNAVRALKPRLLDRENAYQLQASFEFQSDKAELQRILSQ